MKKSRLLLVMLVLLTPYSAMAGRCTIAMGISIENLHYRMLSPTVDQVRVQRAFEELAALDKICSQIKVNETSENCREMGKAIPRAGKLSLERLSTFEKVTNCKLPSPEGISSEKLIDIKEFIGQTLREQQDSDGEGSYWVADDLLALLLVYPEEVIDSVLAYPSFHARFISDLGGNAFEDLDDTPGSQHLALQNKMHAFADVLSYLRRNKKMPPERAGLIAEMEKACHCSQWFRS